ncbi:DUF4267 domain-containing protein [Spirosoma endbachense]|uniref:DUF4267 domain-containing protein n=2 Tax=Spirosoma endbachense TaxID=2666025 RepID=A0A6P1VWP0_9BACT|nr:DUF4267 domain-containing protein [Spirosoma endbachense]
MRALWPCLTFALSNKPNTTMQTEKLPLWAKIAGYFFGIALLFIGIRFLVLPEAAERGFGLIYNQPTYAFHFIKGIRDFFTGLLLTSFTIANWRKPLALAVLVGSLIPVVDMLVVLNAPDAVPGTEWIHGLTAVASWIFSYFLFRKS